MKQKFLTLLGLAVVVFVPTHRVDAQSPQTQAPGGGTLQAGQMGDLVRELNLTAEQREQIRSIREQNKSERAAINARLTASNRSLEEALDQDNPSEALVEQRLREVAAAQSEVMRMRTLTEVRIRRVLTQEQRNTLRLLRQQANQLRLERRQMDPERQRRRDMRILKNQRNGLGPAGRRQQNRP